MDESRRATDPPSWGETGRILAILYTVGFFAVVITLMWKEVPAGNRDTMNMLVGILSIIQTGIVAFHFGGSKSAEVSQKQIAASKDRAEVAIQEIAKTVVPAVPANGEKK